MIIEAIINIACNLIGMLFSTLEIIHLPLDIIETLYTILCYGTWVVGADVLLIFAGSVVMWWTAKWTVGFGIWLYEHLPFI